jgi:hypothetical protein
VISVGLGNPLPVGAYYIVQPNFKTEEVTASPLTAEKEG